MPRKETVNRENAIYDSAAVDSFDVKLDATSAKRLRVTQKAKAEINPEHIRFCTAKGTATFPLRFLRRYGIQGNEKCYLEAGRRCESGEGMVNFKTKQGEDSKVLDLLDRFTAILAAEDASPPRQSTASAISRQTSISLAAAAATPPPSAALVESLQSRRSGTSSASAAPPCSGSGQSAATTAVQPLPPVDKPAAASLPAAAGGVGGAAEAAAAAPPPAQAPMPVGGAWGRGSSGDGNVDAERYAFLCDAQRVTEIETHGQTKEYSVLAPAQERYINYGPRREESQGPAPVDGGAVGGGGAAGAVDAIDADDALRRDSPVSPGQLYAEMNMRKLSQSRSSTSSSNHYGEALHGAAVAGREEGDVARHLRGSTGSASSHGYGNLPAARFKSSEQQ